MFFSIFKELIKNVIMKKLLIIAIVFAATTSLSAQKGSIYAGGAIGFK